MRGGLYEGVGVMCNTLSLCSAFGFEGVQVLDTHHVSGQAGCFGGLRGGVCA